MGSPFLKNERAQPLPALTETNTRLERAGQGPREHRAQDADHRAAIEALRTGMAALDARVAALRETLRAQEEKALPAANKRDVIDAAMARMQDTATAAKSPRRIGSRPEQAAADRLSRGARAQAEDAKERCRRHRGESTLRAGALRDAEAVDRRQHQGRLKAQAGQPPPPAGGRRRSPAESRPRKIRRHPSIHILEDLERNMDGYQQSVKSVMQAARSGPSAGRHRP